MVFYFIANILRGCSELILVWGHIPISLKGVGHIAVYMSDLGPQLIPQSCPGPRVLIWTVFNWPRLSETPPWPGFIERWGYGAHYWSGCRQCTGKGCGLWCGAKSWTELKSASAEGRMTKAFCLYWSSDARRKTVATLPPIQWARAGIQSHFSLGSHGSFVVNKEG